MEGRHRNAVKLNLKPTPRQLEVLALVRDGYNNRQIGSIVSLQESTIKNHVREVAIRLSVPNRTAAVVKAIRLGLITLEGTSISNSKRQEVNCLEELKW